MGVSWSVRMLEDYVLDARIRVGCPLVALGGGDDGRITAEQLLAWEEYATSRFEMVLFEGCGHGYIKENVNELFEFLSAYFRKLNF